MSNTRISHKTQEKRGQKLPKYRLDKHFGVSVRRILVSISSGCPYQDIFATAYRCLQALPNPG